jgi:hypothetical protein
MVLENVRVREILGLQGFIHDGSLTQLGTHGIQQITLKFLRSI